MFDEIFGGGRGRSSRTSAQQGSDLRFDLEIDFEEAVFGSQREITLPIAEGCAACDGSGVEPGSSAETCRQCGGRGAVISSSGFFQIRQTCPICGGSGRVVTKPCRGCQGTGRVKARKRLTLKIPPGVDTGARLRLSGRGEGGVQGGPPGDLYVILHVRPHELFRRDGNDLFCEIPVPFDVAALGGEVEVPTTEGFARLKIDAGVENGKTYRLRGRGVSSPDSHGRGDLHVRIVIEVPSHLSAKQKKVLKEFADTVEASNYPQQQRVRERTSELLRRRDEINGAAR